MSCFALKLRTFGIFSLIYLTFIGTPVFYSNAAPIGFPEISDALKSSINTFEQSLFHIDSQIPFLLSHQRTTASSKSTILLSAASTNKKITYKKVPLKTLIPVIDGEFGAASFPIIINLGEAQISFPEQFIIDQNSYSTENVSYLYKNGTNEKRFSVGMELDWTLKYDDKNKEFVRYNFVSKKFVSVAEDYKNREFVSKFQSKKGVFQGIDTVPFLEMKFQLDYGDTHPFTQNIMLIHNPNSKRVMHIELSGSTNEQKENDAIWQEFVKSATSKSIISQKTEKIKTSNIVEEDAFSIGLPKGWKTSSIEGEFVMYAPDQITNIIVSIISSEYTDYSQEHFKYWVDSFTTYFKNEFTNFKVIKSKKATLSGKPALSLEYTFESESGALIHGYMVITFKDGVAYQFTATTGDKKSMWGKYKKQIQKAATTLVFK